MRPVPAAGLVLALSLGAASSAAAPGEEGERPAAAAPRPPLTVEEFDRITLRGERNLVLHGLSLDARYLGRAVGDFRVAAAGLPADADADRRFSAWFPLAFSLARVDLPPGPKDAETQLAEIGTALGKAAEIAPGFPGLPVVEGLVLEKTGNLPAAAEAITRGLEGLPAWKGLRPWQVYQLRLFGLLARGRVFLEPDLNRELLAEKDFKEALALATEALKDPEAPRENRLRTIVLTHLAAAKQRLEYYGEAVEILEELRREDPGNPSHPYNLALVRARLHEYPQAVELYRKAAEMNRGDPRPHLKIAYILLSFPEQGKPVDLAGAEKAATVYLNLVGQEDAEFCSMRGVIAVKREDEAAAETWFRKALLLRPDCQLALSELVRILGRREDRTEEQRQEMKDLLKRLDEAGRKRNQGKGMETRKSDFTFC